MQFFSLPTFSPYYVVKRLKIDIRVEWTDHSCVNTVRTICSMEAKIVERIWCIPIPPGAQQRTIFLEPNNFTTSVSGPLTAMCVGINWLKPFSGSTENNIGLYREFNNLYFTHI